MQTRLFRFTIWTLCNKTMNKYTLFYLIKTVDAIPQITKRAILQNRYTLRYFKIMLPYREFEK